MRITSKGQVTIPAEVRERAGLLPNTEVDFIVDAQGVHIVKAPIRRSGKPTRGERFVQRLRGTGIRKMTTDEIMRLMRADE